MIAGGALGSIGATGRLDNHHRASRRTSSEASSVRLGRSRRNMLEIHGRLVTIEFFQSGAKAQGRIRIPAAEVERIQELMRVKPRSAPIRRPPVRQETYPFIAVPLGYPR